MVRLIYPQKPWFLEMPTRLPMVRLEWAVMGRL